MSGRFRVRLFILIIIGSCAVSPAVLARKTSAPTAKQAQQVLEKDRPLAEKGDAAAQYNMGVLYDRGYGVKQDFTKARQWYEKAAAQHYGRAEHNLGIMYESGKGVPRDPVKAAKWFRRGADDGVAASQNNLAVLYMKGLGVPQNTGKAAFWTARAAAAGNRDAIENLPQITSGLPTVHANADSVNVRGQPSRESRIVHHVDSDTVLVVLARRNDWTQVLLPSGYTTGWIANFLLSDSQAPLAGQGGANETAATTTQKTKQQPDTAGATGSRKAATSAPETAHPQAASKAKTPADKDESKSAKSSAASPATARVGVDAANVRSKPSGSAKIIGQLHEGDEVRLLDERNGWRYVRTQDGLKGWLAGYLLVTPSD